jgi:hypothetical protein
MRAWSLFWPLKRSGSTAWSGTVKLQDGRVDGGCFGQGATYSVSGDRITFNSPESGYSTTFTFSADGEGNLHLTPVPPMDKGDAFQCSYKAWTKIG